MVISHSVLPRIFRLVVGFELAFTQYIHVPNTISIAYTIIHVYVLREWWLIHKIHVILCGKSTIHYQLLSTHLPFRNFLWNFRNTCTCTIQ